ncbi:MULTISPECIES: DNA cytosine methyltransferase [Vibrio]|uniref:DNA cytosine methyltransferase n=1 Tax=Vibrio TaxID=662 RepID=UPI001E34AA6C|nr:DNA cytosine methyltransferase [Vibrio lentus]MCC4838083.1 DNA cytosine methyltransferase [Vibrio lentus]
MKIPFIDMCAGIGTFSYANALTKNSAIDFIGSCEIDTFCNRVLHKHGHELLGPLDWIGKPESENQHSLYCKEIEHPACELTGLTTITHEEIMEGVVEWPKGICIGFPCQNISPASTEDLSGVAGSKSSIIDDALSFAEKYDLEYMIMENSSLLPNRGLDVLLTKLDSMGFAAEWEIINAVNFGYPYYRSRCFVIAYKENTAPLNLNEQVFTRVAKFANQHPGDKFPLLDDHSPQKRELAVTLETKGNFRRDRVGALGNAVVLDKAKAIIQSLSDMIIESQQSTLPNLNFDRPNQAFDINQLEVNKAGYRVMPKRGFMINSQYYTDEDNNTLNPPRSTYKNLSIMPSLIRSDMKNNFTSSSRTSRPGTLGGLVGALQTKFGFDAGGLNPHYCELLQGFPKGFTEVVKNELSFKLPS